MPSYIAFLRAINVGGHTVRMEALRLLFESLGFSNVETFIASGNVIFQTRLQNPAAAEAKIISGMQTALGYEVAAFIRTPAELAQIVAYQPFPQAELDQAAAFNVAFLHSPLNDIEVQKLMALRTEIDNFAVYAREVYWLCRKIQSQSTFSNAVLEKTLGVKSTLRGLNTLKKLSVRVAEESKA